MKIQWFLTYSSLCFFLQFHSLVHAQIACIQAADTVCIGDCLPVTYVGTNSNMATYDWTISCGTITNPTLMNPHDACYLQAGNCTIQLITQEPGSAPDTCIKSIFVSNLPTARFVARTDSLCAGNCLGIRVDFTGTPPFIFKVRDTFGVTTYRSGTNSKIISLCPTASQTYAIISVEDAHCINLGVISFLRLKVFPAFKALIFQQFSKLCTSPPVNAYRWFECNTINLVGTSSCFTPPKEDCYCAVLFNGFCYDTVCANFKCNLTCGISYTKPSYINDKIEIKYTGNGGPSTKKIWTYTIDNVNYTTSSLDSLSLVFTKPGCYPISLEVMEEICVSKCVDTICVISRPCTCGTFNKNEVIQTSAINNSCCYQLNGELSSGNCFTSMKVLTTSGTFSNVQANSGGGWQAQNVGTQSIIYTHNSGNIPTGSFNAGNFCVQNSPNHTITVYYYYDNNGKKDSCKYQYVFQCSNIMRKCDSVSANLELLNPNQNCCYSVHANNGRPSYFTQIAVNVSGANLLNVNPGAGFNLVSSNSQSFSVNHPSGFIPTGMIIPGSFCLNNVVNPVSVNLFFIRNVAGVKDTCKYNFQLYCPDDGSPKDNCCDSTTANLISFGSQGCCWNLFSFSKKAKCISKICVTGTGFSFSGLVANAGYLVSSINNGVCFTHATGTIPAGSVNPGRFCITGFSNPLNFNINYYDVNGQLLTDCKQSLTRECKIPPMCSCDSLDNQIFQTTTLGGNCCHNFLATVPNSACYSRILVSVNSGSFNNIVASSGFIASGGGNNFIITHNSGHIPAGNSTPANFCVTGSTLYTITIQYFYLDQNGIEQNCLFSQVFDCPQPKPSCGCDSLSTTINQKSITPGLCCYDFTSHVGTPNCFTKIGMSVTAGSFSNISTASGYLFTVQSSSSFSVNHTSGHIPLGNITPASFCVTGANLYTITIQYFYLDQNGIEQRCIKSETFNCKPIQSDCNCDSLIVNLNSVSNSPGQCCYEVKAYVGSDKCFTRFSVSTTAGSINSIIVPIGYVFTTQSNSGFSVTHSSGYMPGGNISPANFCVNGATTYTITIQFYYIDNNGIEQRCVHSKTFDCPPPPPVCSCDSVKTNIIQTNNNPGLCCHKIEAQIPSSNCIVAMTVTLSSGSFTNVIPGTNFTIGNLTTNSFNVGHTSGFLPIGLIQLVSFCVSGSTLYNISVKYLYFSNGKLDSCQLSKSFDCKPLDTSSMCDHSICTGSRSWQNISSFNGIVYDLKTYNCKLYAAGQFTTFANQAISNIAEWNGTSWQAIPGGGLNGTVRCMTVYNNKLYVGGQFTLAGNVAVNNIAAWDGTNWTNVGGGVTGISPAPVVYSLLVDNNSLIVAGQFALLGNNTLVNNIASWNGSWSGPFANGIPYPISSLRRYNNDLYAAGAFFGNPYNSIAKWNGTIWNPLTVNGINLVTNTLNHGVEALFPWNNELWIGGHFANADGITNTQHIARWNGTNFSATTEGQVPVATNSVNDFIKYNGDLFVAGEFAQIGNTTADGVVESLNSTWSSVNHPNKVTWALETYDSCGSISCDLYSAGEGFVNRWSCITSTKHASLDLEWNVFPNPVQDELNIDLSKTKIRDFKLNIKSIQGQNLFSKNYTDNSILTIPTNNLSEGIYIIEILDKNLGKVQKKFIKVN